MIGDRRESKKIWVGDVPVGGDSPITVQSMTKTDTRDVDATVNQIRELEEAGCEIIRSVVPTQRSQLLRRSCVDPLLQLAHSN